MNISAVSRLSQDLFLILSFLTLVFTFNNILLIVVTYLVHYNQGVAILTKSNRSLVLGGSLFDLELHEASVTVHV